MTNFERTQRIARLEKILKNQGRGPGDRKCHLKLAEMKSLKRQLEKLSASPKARQWRKGRLASETPSRTPPNRKKRVAHTGASPINAATRTDRHVAHIFFDDCPFC